MKSNLNNTLVALVAAIFATAPTPQASAQDKLTLAGLAVTPASEQNICIGKDGTARDVSMSTFQVTSNADEDLTVDSISVFINCAGSVSRISPDTLKVFEGATLRGTSIPNGESQLSIGTGGVVIPAHSTKTFTVKGDFTFSRDGEQRMIKLEVDSIHFQGPGFAGNSFSQVGTYGGPILRFFPAVASWQMVTSDIYTNNVQGATTVSGSFTFNVTAIGGDVAKPKGGDFTVLAEINGVEQVLCPMTMALVNPNVNVIPEGSTVTVMANVAVSPDSLSHSGLCSLSVAQINWTAGGVKVEQYWGLEGCKTPSPVMFNKVTGGSQVTIHMPIVGFNLWDDIRYANTNGGEWSYKAQAVGEGRIMFISPFWPDEVRYIVVPVDNNEGGVLVGVNADVTTTDITPKAPFGDSGSLPIENVVKYGTPVVTKVTYIMTLGSEPIYVSLVRTGDNACVAKAYWGSSANFDSPGDTLDCLDLSASSDAPAPDKGLLANPVRMKFGIESVMKGSSDVPTPTTLIVNGLPNSFTVEMSTDLATWTTVPSTFLFLSQNEDRSMRAVVHAATGNPPKAFFRLKAN